MTMVNPTGLWLTTRLGYKQWPANLENATTWPELVSVSWQNDDPSTWQLIATIESPSITGGKMDGPCEELDDGSVVWIGTWYEDGTNGPQTGTFSVVVHDVGDGVTVFSGAWNFGGSGMPSPWWGVISS